jgi:serine/threonine protein kinase/TolB-like protein
MPEVTGDSIAVGTVIGGIYEVTRLIGRGGTSVVWAARHRRLAEREVAIKVLLLHASVDATRLRREAEILSRLSHPHIVQILDFDELPGGTPYMVLELLHGETLRGPLSRGRLRLDSSLAIATQIGSALSAAHQVGVVHRDIKPNNIFLCPPPELSSTRDYVKVLDFGISVLQDSNTLTTLSTIGGTPQYMAPEQLRGDTAGVDARADIFALGAVLYEMLAGRPAFKGETITQVAWQVVYEEPRPLPELVPDVPDAVAAAVGRALEKDPAHRFQSAAAFVSALREPALPAASTRRSTRTRSARWVAAAGVVLVASVGALLLLRPGDAPLPQFTNRASQEVADSHGAADKVAVMEFENQRPRDSQSDWYRKALQTAVNTELSSVDEVAVVAPELIQRTAGEGGVDRMEAARRLGVRRFITGSFAVVGNVMRIDARIVDTANGLQESAETVEGSRDEFFALQRRLALAMLDHLRVTLTQAQRASLSTGTNASVDRYRKLLEAEGLTQREPRQHAAPAGPQSRAQPARGSSRRLAALFVGVAHAQEVPPGAKQAARQVLEAYRRAHEQGDLARLAALYVSFPEEQRRAVQEYVKNIKDLHIELADVQIEPRGRDILVSYTRQDQFIDKTTGERMSLQVRLTRFLVQDGGAWKFAAEQ